MRPGLANPLAIARLLRILTSERPAIVQSWMYHANLLGVIAVKLARIPHFAWNVRASDLDLERTHHSLRRVFTIHGLLSSIPDAIVVNSNAGLKFHQAHGHHARRWELIRNGFDTERFRPREDLRGALRARLGLPAEQIVIGMIARFHPMKEHRTFLRAARLLLDGVPNVSFILAGSGVTIQNPDLAAWIRELRLEGAVHLLGEQADTAAIYPALDMATLCSRSGEGMPNMLGEAMCCGVECVATDVGDSAFVVGETGTIVPIGDAQALADAWRRRIDAGAESRQKAGELARHRIEQTFSLPAVVAKYERLYEELAACAE